jgi:acyl dehydratase
VIASPPLQFDLDALERWTADRPTAVTEEDIRAFARATNDEAAAAYAGAVAPPVFAIVPAWAPLQEAAAATAPAEARPRVVHGEQDIFIHVPIEPGMALRTRAAAVGIHVKESGTTVVLKTETRDREDRLLNEQYVTEFYRGVSGGEGGGATAPGHRAPEELAGAPPDAELTYPVDADQTYRYAKASGDDHDIHLDDAAARGAGLPGIIVHGLCLMAFAGRAVLESQGQEDPAAVRRLAVRFSRPLAPGGAVTTRIHDLGNGGALAFDAVDADGNVILKDGRAELRDGDGRK